MTTTLSATTSAPRRALTNEQALRRYPCLAALIIDLSAGYATPMCAIRILMDARDRKQNLCEWVATCYRCSALDCVKHALRLRPRRKMRHRDYFRALLIVKDTISGARPTHGLASLASWM